MKNILRSLLLISFIGFASCQPEQSGLPSSSEEWFSKITQWEISSGKDTGLTLAVIDSCLNVAEKTGGQCYTAIDIIGGVLPVFGNEYGSYMPVNNWHIQDVNFCGLGRLFGIMYEVNPDGSISYVGGGGPQWDSIQWVMYDEIVWRGDYLQFETYNGTPCGGYQPPCNGLHDLTMRAFYQGAVYENSGEVFVLINNVPDSIPMCKGGFNAAPWYDTPDSTFYFDDQNPFYLSGSGDLSGDAQVNTADLIVGLSNLCGNE